MRGRNRSRVHHTQKRQYRRKIAYLGGAFDMIGSIRVEKNPGKRLVISFDESAEFPTNNIRMYIRESSTALKKKDMVDTAHIQNALRQEQLARSLHHNYLDIPISKCSPSDIIKIKFLYIQWQKSLPETAEIPSFRWSDAFNARCKSLGAADKKELVELQASFFAAEYLPLYADLLMKYEDPFGGAFDVESAKPPSSSQKPDKHKPMSVLEKMNRENAALETSQAQLQTRRRQQQPKQNQQTRMQKIWSALGRITKPKP